MVTECPPDQWEGDLGRAPSITFEPHCLQLIVNELSIHTFPELVFPVVLCDLNLKDFEADDVS